jgi:hypothetical protein
LVISVSQVFLVSLVDLILTRTSLREKTQVKAKVKVKAEVKVEVEDRKKLTFIFININTGKEVYRFSSFLAIKSNS